MHAHHEGSGARFASFAGALIPDAFGDVGEEYDVLRRHAGVLDVSFRALLMVRGRDAPKFLNNIVTNDVAALSDGSGCHALKVSLQGKVEAALRLLRVGDDIWCDLEPTPLGALIEALRKRIILADVALHDESDRWATFSIQGPRASALLAALGLDVQRLQAMHAHTAATLGDVPVRVVRSDHTGDGGYDVFVAVESAPSVWDALLACDAAVRPVGLAALDARRIEAGIPWTGREITSDRLPQEVGLDEGWISHTKGCYLGQETIARLHHLGHVNRHLRGLLVQGEASPMPGNVLRAAGKEVGTITSAAVSPRLEQPIALAYLRRGHAEPGERVEVVSGSETMHAEVVALPMP
jgi:folate-binding protein YgfZ